MSDFPGGSASGMQTTPNYKRQRGDSDEPGGQGTIKDAAGYIQLRRCAVTHVGSELTRQETLNRHLESIMFQRIDRWQKVNKVNDTNGNFWLSYTQDAATPTKYAIPLYMFDLTSLAENTGVNASGITATWKAAPFTRLVRTAASPYAYTWERQNGVSGALVPGPLWNTERKPYATTANNTPYNKAFLRWADLRLQFWGAQSMPTSAEVLLVRLTDENLGPSSFETNDDLTYLDTHPPPSTPGGALQGASNDYAQYQKFWTSQIDSLLGTPISIRMKNRDSEGMQVLHRRVIHFNPVATYEAAPGDPAGHQVTMKIRYHMDLVGDYNHYNNSNQSGDMAGAILNDPNIWPTDIEVYDNHAVLRNRTSRVFLMVRGLSPSLNTDSNLAGSTTNNASFDLMVRRCITLV